MFFFRATDSECQAMKDILCYYEEVSGQAVNFNKSGILFSANVQASDRHRLSNILGVHQSMAHGRYLGLPSMIGKRKCDIFRYLKDRIWQRMQSWSHRFLSRAGKEILLKSVVQAMPAYAMSVFLLPVSLCEKIQRMMNSFWWGTKPDGRKNIHWLSWDRMCDSKTYGGMGFRDLQSFNYALLGKQGWRLCSNPHTLPFRIYKVKYFPEGNFLKARLRSNPSFTWRSIWQTGECMKTGLRWRVGSGENIFVGHEPWIPREIGPFLISDGGQLIDEHLRVSDLIDPHTRRWNLDLLLSLFSIEDIRLILSIPLPSRPCDDKLIWHHERSGIYSVKSAYYQCRRFLGKEGNISTGFRWSKLWDLALPPKGKDFLWRALRGILPSKEQLLQRGIQVHPYCDVCGERESMNHIFISCPKARHSWGLWGGFLNPLPETITSLLSMLLDNKDDYKASEGCMLLRELWMARNSLVWNGTDLSPQAIVSSTVRYYSDWFSAMSSNQSRQSQCSLSSEVEPLPESHLAFVDGAVFRNECRYGFGMVLEDGEGVFLQAISGHYEGLCAAPIVEAIAVREALSWLVIHCQTRVTLFTDSLQVVQAIYRESADLSEMGCIIQECQDLLQQRSTISVRWVRRQANVAAHCLARASTNHACFSIWNSVPVSISNIIQ